MTNLNHTTHFPLFEIPTHLLFTFIKIWEDMIKSHFCPNKIDTFLFPIDSHVRRDKTKYKLCDYQFKDTYISLKKKLKKKTFQMNPHVFITNLISFMICYYLWKIFLNQKQNHVQTYQNIRSTFPPPTSRVSRIVSWHTLYIQPYHTLLQSHHISKSNSKSWTRSYG